MSQATIKGMSCAHCAANVTRALESLSLTQVQVNFQTGTASFAGHPTEAELKSAIDEAGYELVAYQAG